MAQLTRLSARLAHIHPAVFVAICFGWFFVPSALPAVGFNILGGLVFLFNFTYGPLWTHGVYSASELTKGNVARWQMIFIASEALCLLTAASFFIAPVPEGEVIAEVSKYLAYAFVVVQLIAWWIAARAFVSVPRGDESPRWLSNTAAVYWLIWAAPIGAWVLRPHIRELRRSLR